MPDLKDIIAKLERENPGCNIAGYVEGDRFHYEASKSVNLPAAAFLYDANPTRLKVNVYTTLPNTHWLYTYMAAREKGVGMIHVGGAANVGVAVRDEVRAAKRAIKVVAGQGPDGPLGKAGGLFAAAASLIAYKKDKDGAAVTKENKLHTNERGLHRALRYYMLAAYAVLGKCANADYEGGNYVCALAVNDSGQIFSWGVNSGSFHHGEVNMLLNYFSDHPAEPLLPPQSIVFSTLTPCQQCSGFLQSVSPGHIFMGQKDTGPFGSAGEATGKYLGTLTDPVLNRVAPGQGTRRREGTEKVKNPTPTKPNRMTEQPKFVTTMNAGVTHSDLDTVLGQLVTDGNIAAKIGEFCKRELSQSYDTLSWKIAKKRPEDVLDQKVKTAVLTYLQQWIATVESGIKIKNIV